MIKKTVFKKLVESVAEKALAILDKLITPLKMENFHYVDNNLFRGSTPNFDDLKFLAKKGIKTIINFKYLNKEELEKIQEYANKLEINYINIPVINPSLPCKVVDEEKIDRFLNIVIHSQEPVFICCSQGKDRTGLMAAIYRIKINGWSFEEAFKEMQEKGFHKNLCFRLKDYLKNFAGVTLNTTAQESLKYSY